MDVSSLLRPSPSGSTASPSSSPKESGGESANFDRSLQAARQSLEAPSSPPVRPEASPKPSTPAAEKPGKPATERPGRPDQPSQPNKPGKPNESERPARPDESGSTESSGEDSATRPDEARERTAEALPLPAAPLAELPQAGLALPLQGVASEPSPAAQQLALIAQALGLTQNPQDAASPAALASASAPMPATAQAAHGAQALHAGLAPHLQALALAPETPIAPELLSEFEARTAAPAPASAHPAAASPGLAAAAAPAPLPSAPSLPATPLSTPPGQPGFAQELGQRLVMMAQGPVKSAQIALNPADLGPVEVRLELRGQEASLVMNAAHPATRAAMEEALPRLREMFAAQGLELGQAQVGTQSGGQTHDPSGGSPRSALASAGSDESGEAAPATDAARVRGAAGLVDTFA